MKVSIFKLSFTAGKYKYSNESFNKLVEKFAPLKISPYTIEFVEEDFDKTDAVVFKAESKFDLIIIDLDKIEKRLVRVIDEKEKNVLIKAQEYLEKEILLCDANFNEEEKTLLKIQQLVTYRPCLGVNADLQPEAIIKGIIDKAEVLLFYTAGKKEVHAWDIKKGDTVLTGAGKIHSDLARGFIKADIISINDLDKFFNLAEAKAKGFVKVVDRDYIMQEGDIIEIKFSV